MSGCLVYGIGLFSTSKAGCWLTTTHPFLVCCLDLPFYPSASDIIHQTVAKDKCVSMHPWAKHFEWRSTRDVIFYWKNSSLSKLTFPCFSTLGIHCQWRRGLGFRTNYLLSISHVLNGVQTFRVVYIAYILRSIQKCDSCRFGTHGVPRLPLEPKHPRCPSFSPSFELEPKQLWWPTSCNRHLTVDCLVYPHQIRAALRGVPSKRYKSSCHQLGLLDFPPI